ncbi:hypothetical protein [Streptomyces glomeratus]|uniref:Uncharacterized protein n=1 Tax=Streptomyces glomeratus TaxID=284452 RepID=A0ABP6M2B9_9ACTN|nr:hypothetical protein [Streptomyces glomeratus]MCF1507861.1 hypothetical protein [Streptomyces glomeratus]
MTGSYAGRQYGDARIGGRLCGFGTALTALDDRARAVTDHQDGTALNSLPCRGPAPNRGHRLGFNVIAHRPEEVKVHEEGKVTAVTSAAPLHLCPSIRA